MTRLPDGRFDPLDFFSHEPFGRVRRDGRDGFADDSIGELLDDSTRDTIDHFVCDDGLGRRDRLGWRRRLQRGPLHTDAERILLG